MSPFERDIILPALRNLNRVGAIHAALLAIEINKAERTARHYLRRLELAGAVYRPAGPRKGWMVIEDNVQLRSIPAGV